MRVRFEKVILALTMRSILISTDLNNLALNKAERNLARF